MIVPRYWAEARAQQRQKRRQVTIRRFGWSMHSQAEAQAMADARAAEALQRMLAGERLIRREPKVAYNGAEGVPIREEIVAEHGDCVITRNSYGALCLNTPDVLFGDVDFDREVSDRTGGVIVIALLVVAIVLAIRHSAVWVFFVTVLGGAFAVFTLLHYGRKGIDAIRGGPARVAIGRARRFLDRHPGWRLRLYRTPAGLRVLAMHRPFAPNDPDVAEFFQALKCDPVYVQMCQRQHCFRARVTPKPWRIGIRDHLRPRPGLWPVSEAAMPVRRAWVDAYHAKAAGFAACRFESELGRGPVHDKVRDVQELHDRLCRAESGLPMA